MQIGSLFGSFGSTNTYEDRQTFGAQVVGGTLNLINNDDDDGLDYSGVTDKKTFGAAVVTKTLGFMNKKKTGGLGGSNSLFQLNQNVLGAHYANKGNIFNTTA
ncbi:MAG: hypothetical protein HY910_04290 [Desulfarculus sp.]|nr:hypothetical protein [Desulfarculus sp.]